MTAYQPKHRAPVTGREVPTGDVPSLPAAVLVSLSGPCPHIELCAEGEFVRVPLSPNDVRQICESAAWAWVAS